MICCPRSEILYLRLTTCSHKIFIMILFHLVFARLICTLIKVFFCFEEIYLVQKGRHLFRCAARWSTLFHVWYYCLYCDFSIFNVLSFWFCAALGPLYWLYIKFLRFDHFNFAFYRWWRNSAFIPCHGVHTLVLWWFSDIPKKPVSKGFHILLLCKHWFHVFRRRHLTSFTSVVLNSSLFHLL